MTMFAFSHCEAEQPVLNHHPVTDSCSGDSGQERNNPAKSDNLNPIGISQTRREKKLGTTKNLSRHAVLDSESPRFQGIAGQARNDECVKKVEFLEVPHWMKICRK